MVELLLHGLNNIFTPGIILIMIAGIVIGIVAGAIPGLNAGIAIALMLPITYRLSFLPSLVFLTSIYTGGVWGGAITAILINAPGSPAAIATTFDGYPLTQKGRSSEALGISIGASALGGFIGMVFLVLVISPLAEFALKFGPPEIFLLIVLALTSVASISQTEFFKGLLAGLFGLLIGTIGLTATGSTRFTFGFIYLIDGVPVIPALIGFIAFPELFELMEREYIAPRLSSQARNLSKILKGVKSVIKNPINLLRSSTIGIIIGAIPGVGATVASLISYDTAKRFSKNPKLFGKGEPAGVIAAESANNASEGGATATMLALGIPGGTATAVLIGAFLIQGLIPGPRLIIEHKQLIYSLLSAELVEEIMLLLIGIFAAIFFVRVLEVPTKILVPIVVVTCLIGSFTVRNTLFDSSLLFAFGVLGWIMKKHKYPVIAIVIGIILGPIADAEFLRTYEMYAGDFTVFFKRPICLSIIILMVIVVVTPYLFGYLYKKRRESI